ncbi:MAG: ABC transporter permease [Vicinamibacteraceae bacterium]
MVAPDTVFQDLRYGVRILYRHAGFTAVVVLALAIGIGVNTAVFTAYKAMVARPLDARDPDGMVNLALIDHSGDAHFTFSHPDYEAYRDSSHSFSGVIAFSPERMTLSNAGAMVSQRDAASESPLGTMGLLSHGTSNAEFASTFVVSESYFEVLGVRAIRGRTFDSMTLPELMASPSVLISENYWQKRFAGDPAMLGRTIHLNGVAVTVIGITPRDFVGTGVAVPGFWLPLSLAPLVHADENWLRDRETPRWRLFARLAPGVSIEQAQAEMAILAGRLRALHDRYSEWATSATALVWPGSPFPLALDMYGGLNLAILLIMSAAALLLIVACANAGSLQLARVRSRRNELQTRQALGASRLRVIRQLLTESALLGLLAGGAALIFAWALLKVSVALFADALPVEHGTLIFDVTPDLVIFAYVVAVSLVAGILFGLAPAIESSRAALIGSIRGATSSTRSRRVQDVLVASQVALCLVLLIAGSMFIRSAIHSLTADPGYDSKQIVDFDVRFSEASKHTDGGKRALIRELRGRIAALPGVTAVTSAQPPGDNRFLTAAVALDRAPATTRSLPSILHDSDIQANYFQTLGIPLFLGRGFPSEGGQAEKSVVLSESAANQLWPGQSPIGRSLRLGTTYERFHNLRELRADGLVYQVIGVARDTRGVELDGSGSKQVYLLLPEDQLHEYPILVRTESDPAKVIRAAERAIASISPDLLTTSSTLDEMLRRSAPFIASSLSAAVASTVGLLGLLLASMGIHGTVSYIVVSRTREVGIRMALGAQRRNVLGLILRESTRPVFAGVLVGMFLAVGASYLLRGILYGLSIVDGASFAGVSLLFVAVASLAAYAPSRRASSVDPTVALRHE